MLAKLRRWMSMSAAVPCRCRPSTSTKSASGLPDLIDEEAGVIELFTERGRIEEPADLLGLLARIARQVQQRCGDVLRVLRSARSDPETAAMLVEADRRERLGVRALIGRVAASGALAGGLTVDRATDVAVALMSPEMSERLVQQSAWSYDEYEHWLVSVLSAALLAPTHRPA